MKPLMIRWKGQCLYPMGCPCFLRHAENGPRGTRTREKPNYAFPRQVFCLKRTGIPLCRIVCARATDIGTRLEIRYGRTTFRQKDSIMYVPEIFAGLRGDVFEKLNFNASARMPAHLDVKKDDRVPTFHRIFDELVHHYCNWSAATQNETQDCISSWHSSQISCQGLETSKTGSGTNVKHREVSIANPFCRGRNVAKQTGRQRRAQTDRFADMVLLSGSLCAIKETLLQACSGTLTLPIGCGVS